MIPFLRLHLPFLQNEIMHFARISKLTPSQFISQNESLILDPVTGPIATSSSSSLICGEPFEIFQPTPATPSSSSSFSDQHSSTTSLNMGIKEGRKRFSPPDSRKENGYHNFNQHQLVSDPHHPNHRPEVTKIEPSASSSQRLPPDHSQHPPPAKRAGGVGSSPHVMNPSLISPRSNQASLLSSLNANLLHPPPVSSSSSSSHSSNSGPLHPIHTNGFNGTNSSSSVSGSNMLQVSPQSSHSTASVSVRAAMLEAEARAEAVAALRSANVTNNIGINRGGDHSPHHPVLLTNGRSHASNSSSASSSGVSSSAAELFSGVPSDRLFNSNSEKEMFARGSHHHNSSHHHGSHGTPSSSCSTSSSSSHHPLPSHHHLMLSYSDAAAAAVAHQRSLSEEISRETEEEWKNIHTVCMSRHKKMKMYLHKLYHSSHHPTHLHPLTSFNA